MGYVIAVCGAVGGIGASTLAYALALQAPTASVLIDARRFGTPLDLLIGAEENPGTRWHQIHVATPDIAVETVLAALPTWNGLRFLSSSAQGTVHQPAFMHLVNVLREQCNVVIDIDARSELIDLLHPDLHIVAVPNTIYGLGGAVAAIRSESELVVMRTQLEDFRAEQFSRYLPNPVLGVVDFDRAVWIALRTREPIPGKTALMRVAESIVKRFADAA